MTDPTPAHPAPTPQTSVPSSTGPSSPPEELQLNALDSSSVLASWRPPLEPNGIIVGYRLLFSSNLSQPDHAWEKLSQDGGCPSKRTPTHSKGGRQIEF